MKETKSQSDILLAIKMQTKLKKGINKVKENLPAKTEKKAQILEILHQKYNTFGS